MNKKILAIYYICLALLLAPILIFWWTGNIPNIITSADNFIAIGRLMGLLASVAILLELLLISRLPIIEKRFELHDNNDLHRLNGFLVLISFVAHIVFITIGYALPFKIGYWNQFIDINQGSLAVLLASIGTILFISVISLSLKAVRKVLPYQIWYLSHLLVYSAIILTFFHQITDGRDFITNPWFKTYWIILFVLVIGSLFLYRFVRPLKYFKHHKFYVDRVAQEGLDIYSIIIKGNDINNFKFEAGQYATIWLLAKGMWWEGHPYSFSSNPKENYIRFTLKTNGDFGKKVPSVPAGTKVIIDGPRGSFLASRAKSKRVILIAGGIGIAPYVSIISQLLRNGKKVTLLYAIHDDSQLVLKKELLALQEAGLNLKIFNSSKNNRINQDTLKVCAQADADIFICGPTEMTKQFCSTLNECGLCKKRIIAERFSY